MRTKLFSLLAACFVIAVFSGCYSTVEGRKKAGMPMSKDTIEARYERPVDQIFEAAKRVLAHNGTLYGENTIAKTLEAKVDNRTVWVAVDEVEPKISRVRVQARSKGGGGDIYLASEINTQIALQLR